MRRSGKAKPVVWRWQARFMVEGVAGLTRDKTRKPGKPPLPAGTVQRVGRGAAGHVGPDAEVEVGGEDGGPVQVHIDDLGLL
jgi:hypothetical protein